MIISRPEVGFYRRLVTSYPKQFVIQTLKPKKGTEKQMPAPAFNYSSSNSTLWIQIKRYSAVSFLGLHLILHNPCFTCLLPLTWTQKTVSWHGQNLCILFNFCIIQGDVVQWRDIQVNRWKFFPKGDAAIHKKIYTCSNACISLEQVGNEYGWELFLSYSV